MKLGRVDHVGVLVEDLDASKMFLETVFGFHEVRTVELDDLRGVFLVSGDVTVELVWIRDGAARAARLDGVDRRLDHLAVSVPDLGRAIDELADAGVKTTPPVDTGAYITTFTDPATSDSIRYQLVEYTTPG
jgi:catechol 2,3-dioxygenase-like lactoylglutathione lyase family enzyme